MTTKALLDLVGAWVPTFGSWDDPYVDYDRKEVEYHTDILSAFAEIGGLDGLSRAKGLVGGLVARGMAELVEDTAVQFADRVNHATFNWERVYEAFGASPKAREYLDVMFDTALMTDDRYYDATLGFRVVPDNECLCWEVEPYIYFGFDDGEVTGAVIKIPYDATADDVEKLMDKANPWDILY